MVVLPSNKDIHIAIKKACWVMQYQHLPLQFVFILLFKMLYILVSNFIFFEDLQSEYG